MLRLSDFELTRHQAGGWNEISYCQCDVPRSLQCGCGGRSAASPAAASAAGHRQGADWEDANWQISYREITRAGCHQGLIRRPPIDHRHPLVALACGEKAVAGATVRRFRVGARRRAERTVVLVCREGLRDVQHLICVLWMSGSPNQTSDRNKASA